MKKIRTLTSSSTIKTSSSSSVSSSNVLKSCTSSDLCPPPDESSLPPTLEPQLFDGDGCCFECTPLSSASACKRMQVFKSTDRDFKKSHSRRFTNQERLEVGVKNWTPMRFELCFHASKASALTTWPTGIYRYQHSYRCLP